MAELPLQPRARRRRPELDLVKSLAIFLVLYGHALQRLLPSELVDDAVMRVIYSFHMPLFMLVAGLFVGSSLRLGFSQMLIKKAQGLLLPVASWSLVMLVCFHYDLLPRPLAAGKEFVSMVLENFWFLKSLFLCYVLCWCGARTGLRKRWWFLLTILVSQAITPAKVFQLYPVFLAGYALSDGRRFALLVRHAWLPAVVWLLLLAGWGRDNFEYHSLYAFLKGDAAEIGALVWSRAYGLAIGLAGSLAAIGLVCRCYGHLARFRLVGAAAWCGRYTLEVYILQVFLLEMWLPRLLGSAGWLDALHAVSPFPLRFVVLPLVALAMLALCIGICRLMERSPLLAFLFFGRKRRQS